ncbi:KCND2 [Symbiodinium natans]|uniref:KCND2 protein n=1 Tax=Symbiodinium natans TaxID=878477 RepID=A0A812LEZ7_9DINO|nr:KCND2 [Symbiodinium natans]
MPLLRQMSNPIDLPGTVKSSNTDEGLDGLVGIHQRLDRLSDQIDLCLSEMMNAMSPKQSSGANANAANTPRHLQAPIPTSPAPRSSIASRASVGSQSVASSFQEEPRIRRVGRSSILSAVTLSTSGTGLSTETTLSGMGRRELLPFNEFGHAEVLTRAQLRRRLGNYRQGRAARAARAQAEFLEDPADARLSAAKQWLLERRRCDAVWLALDEPQSSRAAWWIALTLRFLVVMSLVLNILEVGDEYPLIHGAAASVLEIGIDSAFFIEFLCRLFSAPSKRTYVLDFYNWADMVSASGLILRATAGFVIAPSSTATESVIQSLLLYVLPIVRLLKLLRYISSFRLLIDAVTNSLEALPVLVYTMVLIVMASASGLYLAESRSNIPTLVHAVWLALVTMTTVGYGDFVPKSVVGYVIASILTVVSVLFIAMPVGLVGYEFTVCWQNRAKVLLLARARKRFAQWGYQSRDVQLLFEYADSDRDGSLNLVEFCELLQEMTLGLSSDSIIELFQMFDDNGDGFIDHSEFVRVLFPLRREEEDGACSDSEAESSVRPSVVANLPAVQESEED